MGHLVSIEHPTMELNEVQTKQREGYERQSEGPAVWTMERRRRRGCVDWRRIKPCLALDAHRPLSGPAPGVYIILLVASHFTLVDRLPVSKLDPRG
jgi:hypothetical protein